MDEKTCQSALEDLDIYTICSKTSPLFWLGPFSPYTPYPTIRPDLEGSTGIPL